MCLPGSKLWQRRHAGCLRFASSLLGLTILINNCIQDDFDTFVAQYHSPANYKWHASDYALEDLHATQHYVESLAQANMTLQTPIHLHAALDLNAAQLGTALLGIADAYSFFTFTAAIPRTWRPVLQNPLLVATPTLQAATIPLHPPPPVTIHLQARLLGGAPKKKQKPNAPDEPPNDPSASSTSTIRSGDKKIPHGTNAIPDHPTNSQTGSYSMPAQT